MNLLFAATLTFSFMVPDSNVIGGDCLHPVKVQASDSVTVEYRAQPLFATGGYMRQQTSRLEYGRGVHAQIILDPGQDSTTYWIATFKTGRWGLLNGQRVLVWNLCPRSIVKLPSHR